MFSLLLIAKDDLNYQNLNLGGHHNGIISFSVLSLPGKFGLMEEVSLNFVLLSRQSMPNDYLVQSIIGYPEKKKQVGRKYCSRGRVREKILKNLTHRMVYKI